MDASGWVISYWTHLLDQHLNVERKKVSKVLLTKTYPRCGVLVTYGGLIAEN